MATERALLVIDMLRDFLEEQGSLYCGGAARKIIPAVADEIARARRDGMAIIYVCDRHQPDDPEFQMFPPHCVRGTAGSEVVDGLSPLEGDLIIPKRRYSAFYGTDLDLALRELGVRELTLVGVCTNICVLYTAADARMRNYRVLVPRNAVATFDEGVHRFALGEMEKTLGVQLT